MKRDEFDQTESPPGAPAATGSGSAALRKRYSPPRIVHRQTLEVFAAQCDPGKAFGGGGGCGFVIAS